MSTVTLTGTYGKADINPGVGYVDIVPAVTQANLAVVVVQDPVRATLDGEGAFSVDIIASDDAGWRTPPIPYIFREFVDGRVSQWMAYVNGPGPVDISALVPLEEAPDVVAYQILAEKGQPDGYAPLDLDGKVPADNLPAGAAPSDHGSLTGLLDNDHPQYLKPDEVLAGSNIVVDTTTTPGSVIIASTASGGGGTSDHGALTGLGDDDHTQYHNNTRGDARYDLKGTATSAVSSHASAADPHVGYQKESEKAAANGYAPLDGNSKVPSANLPTYPTVITDHGGLGGLGDDDHPHYHNNTRGDARYDLKGTAASGDSAHVAASDPHPQYAADDHVHASVSATREFFIYLEATVPTEGRLHIESLGGTNRRFRVSATDADGQAYTLAPLLPGDSITITDDPAEPPVQGFARYVVDTDVIDQGTYWQFDAMRTDTTGSQTTVAGTRVRFIPTLSGGSVSAPLSLDDLVDVDTSGAVNGEVLTYGDGTWRPTVVGTGGGGVTDHGALTGLADDDHPHYLTNGRGDSRYDSKGTAAAGDSAHVAAGDPHPQYLTSAEGAAIDHVHDLIGAERLYVLRNTQMAPNAGELTTWAAGGQSWTIRLSKTDAQGSEYSAATMLNGDMVKIIDTADPLTQWGRFKVTTDILEMTTYWQFTATRYDTTGPSLEDGITAIFSPTDLAHTHTAAEVGAAPTSHTHAEYQPLVQPINAQVGVAYTPVAEDSGRLVTMNNAAAITVTLPQDSSASFPTGSRVDFMAIGTGMITFVPESGAVVNGTPSAVSRAQWSAVTAIKRAANTWVVVGDLAT